MTVLHQAVDEPVFDGHRVTGVRTGDGATVDADLVVDATGRGTRLPVWLAQWGFERPREDTVDVGISYATHQVRIPDGLINEKVVVAGASREQPLGLGMLFYEDGNWGVTTFGTGKVAPPADFDEMCALADEILPDHVSNALRRVSRSATIALHKYPASRWRRYDELDRFPAGIVPFGDAVVELQSDVRPRHDDDVAAGRSSAAGAADAHRESGAHPQPCHREDDLPGVDDERDRRPDAARRHRPDAAVVSARRLVVRSVPRRGGDRSRSGGMVSAPIQPARQPLDGAVGQARRPHGAAQHAAVAGREAG